MQNLNKRKNYAANFEIENFENNLQYAIVNFNFVDDNILNNCLYIDVNNIKKNSYLKLIIAVINYKQIVNNENFDDESIITYRNKNFLFFLMIELIRFFSLLLFSRYFRLTLINTLTTMFIKNECKFRCKHERNEYFCIILNDEFFEHEMIHDNFVKYARHFIFIFFFTM